MKYYIFLFLLLISHSIITPAKNYVNDSLMMDRKIDSLISAARQGEIYASQDQFDSAYIFLNRSIELLAQVEPEKVIAKDIYALPIIYNAMAVYLKATEKDFKSAVSYFHKSMKYSEKYGLWEAYTSVAFNIVYIFFSNNSSDGMVYAQELYDKGLYLKDEKMTSIGAYCIASMYFVQKEYDKSRKFIDEVLSSNYVYLMEANTYSLKANLDRISGNMKSADEYYREAIVNLDGVPASERIYICLSYADFLIETGKYAQAVDLIYKGIRIGENFGIHDYRQNAFLLLSEAYDHSAQWKSAYEAYKQYCGILIETFNLQKQKEISEMVLKYDTEKKEAELERRSLMIEYKNSQLYFAGLLIFLLVAASISTYLMYRNKNRMYQAIMEKYKSDSERRMAEKRIRTNVNMERSESIFSILESMMNEQHLYRDNNLTREILADKLNTNRTYLSKVINDATGKNFSQYINSYRVAESVQILSDKEQDINLKSIPSMVGFNSMATFYRIFQEEVGMPPAKFRELSRR